MTFIFPLWCSRSINEQVVILLLFLAADTAVPSTAIKSMIIRHVIIKVTIEKQILCRMLYCSN